MFLRFFFINSLVFLCSFTSYSQNQSVFPSNQLINDTKNKVITSATDSITKKLEKTKNISNAVNNLKRKQENINLLKQQFPNTSNITNRLNDFNKLKSINSSVELVNKVETYLPTSRLKKVWDKTVYSLDLTLSPSSLGNLVRLTPAMGVRITKFYTLGIGFPMQYATIDKMASTKGREDFLYGIKLYHRINLPKGLYFQLENDFLNSGFSEDAVRRWMPAMWTGVGYNLKLNKDFGASASLLYNPLYKENFTPYQLPVELRIGFNWFQPTKSIISPKSYVPNL